MQKRVRNILLGVGCAALAGLLIVAHNHASTAGEAEKTQQTKDGESMREQGERIAETHMEQWKRKNPHRVEDWIAEEKARHTIVPPADNSDLLTGEQGEGHTYGEYTAKDLLIWEREVEKLVVEGSRIFHDAEKLGGTVGVSCDMCHPDASNTHPETYPKFQPQMGRVALLRDMINWCIEHPVRGERFDADAPEMRALEAYIYAQRRGTELNYGKH